MRRRRPVVLPDIPVELLDGPFDAVTVAGARALGLDLIELVKMRGNRRLLRAGLPPRYEVDSEWVYLLGADTMSEMGQDPQSERKGMNNGTKHF